MRFSVFSMHRSGFLVVLLLALLKGVGIPNQVVPLDKDRRSNQDCTDFTD